MKMMINEKPLLMILWRTVMKKDTDIITMKYEDDEEIDVVSNANNDIN